MRSILVIPAALAVGCAPVMTPAAQTHEGGMTSLVVARTALTVSGQPLRLPQGRSEMIASVVDIAAGGSTVIHQHPWSRLAYVERGPLRVVNQDTHQVSELQTGQAFAEAVGQWHQGFAPGPNGARLIIFDLVPAGEANTVVR